MPTASWLLVTGGAGYIGSHCCVDLLNAGYSLVVVDAFCFIEEGQSKPESLRRVESLANRQVDFFNIDIRHADKLDEVFRKYKFEAVLHFASLKSVPESIKEPIKYYTCNIGGSTAIVFAMKKHGVKRLIFSSTAAVYGPPEYLPVDEKHRAGKGLTNPYATTKYFMEEIFQDVCVAEKDWSVVILRYFNPVGSHKSGLIGEDPMGPANNLMPYVARVAVGALPHLQITGNDYDTPDGTPVRDYVHILDISRGHISALAKTKNTTGCQVFNLGSGKGYSVLEVVRAFQAACGRHLPYKIVNRRPGDLADVHCCAKKAFDELGWKPKYDLDDMCADVWRFQEKNPLGYKGGSSTRTSSSVKRKTR